MKISKTQAKEKIEEFFLDVKSKKKEQIRKIKKLAMAHNFKLREKRKLFCQRCYSTRLRVLGIKNEIKRVLCEDCRKVYRWKI